RFGKAAQWLFWPFPGGPDRPACAAESTGAACRQHQSRMPREETMKHLRLVAALAVAGLSAGFARCTAAPRPFTDARAERGAAVDASDRACRLRALVSAGGPFPRNPHTLAVRWIGFANFELVYNGRIILLDAYYDRGSTFPPLGVKAADIKTADLMLIGHGH